MSRKATLAAAVFVLLAGITAFALLRPDRSPAQAGAADVDAGNPDGAPPASSLAPTTAKAKSPARTERELRDAELVSQYGESRTNLSRHVVENVASLLDDAVAMGEMMTSEKGAPFGGQRQAVNGALRDLKLELDDQQQAKVTDLYKEFQKRELARSKTAIESVRKDPSSLMGLLLASDARARGELSEEQYQAFQTASADELQGIINPLDRDNFRGGNPLEDDAFRTDFQALLDADQAATFDSNWAAKQADSENEKRGSDITQIPVMELEQLDQAITSAQKMTSGFRQVMEGMGSLQELGPLIEAQQKDQDQ